MSIKPSHFKSPDTEELPAIVRVLPPDPREYLSLLTIARRLDCSVRKVHLWVQNGRLKAVNLNPPGQRPMWRVPREIWEKFKTEFEAA